MATQIKNENGTYAVYQFGFRVAAKKTEEEAQEKADQIDRKEQHIKNRCWTYR